MNFEEKRDLFKGEGIMGMKHEVREWLCLAPGDIPIWFAAGLVLAMKYVKNTTIDWIFTVIALSLSIFACFIGMKKDIRVSAITNIAKKVTYPFIPLFVGLFAYFNFKLWN